MSFLRSAKAGLRSLFRRPVVEQEIDDELHHFLVLETEENLRAGMTPAAAERAARIHVGVSSTREMVRSGGWESHVESALQDLRHALIGLRRNPSFTAVAVITLALGIGANTAMFSVVNAVMLRPLPYHDAANIALIWTNDVRRGLPREGTAYSTVLDWRSANRAFESVAYFSTERIAPMSNDPLASRGHSRSGLVSANLFDVLGVAPAVGRTISSVDEKERTSVAVISHSFWQRWFGGASDTLGKTIAVEDPARGGLGELKVIGIMPADFYFPDRQTEIWTPATTYWRFARESSERFPAWARRWTAIGRLRPNASMVEARADIARVGQQLAATYSGPPDFPGFGATVLPVLDSIAGENIQSALWILLSAVSIVWLVACVNVANLLLARGASRQQEFAVRRALGAGRGRLLRQLITESMLLAFLGGGVGMMTAAGGTRILGVAAAAYVPRINEIAMDWRVLLFAIAASVAAGLVFGLAPAWRLSGTDASEALKEGGQGTGRLRLRRSRDLLVVAECSLAIVLLTGAGLLLRSLERVQSVDPGFEPRQVLTMRIEFPSEPPPTADERTQTSDVGPARAGAREEAMNGLIARLRSFPGVLAVGFSDDLFLGGQGHAFITIPGRAADQIAAGELNDGAVTPGFFSALKVPLRRGRYLTRDDAVQKIRALWSVVQTDMSLAEKERQAVPEPVVVNEAFVERFFAAEDPLGKRFCIDPTNKTYWYEIVGVIGDMHRQGLEHRAIPEYFGPYFPSPNGRADLLVRVAGDPIALASTIRPEVMRAFPRAGIASIATADAQLGDFSALRRLQTSLLSLFALLAMSLAAVGIFGLAHYAVAERTREIGVRVAIGATPRDISRLVLVQGMRTPALGLAIGLVASAALTRVMSHLLFGIGALDPLTFGAVSIVLLTVAWGACHVAARRASRVDPIQALRRT